MIWRRKHRLDRLDWVLIDILKRDLDWHNAELHKAADEIERLRAEVRALETDRDQWQTKAVSRD